MYKVTIKECVGTCDSALFKKMAEKGDIQATRIKDAVDSVVSISGYAICSVKTDDKEFDVNYYATDDGFISSGSEVFLNSVKDYYGETKYVKILKVSTKRGNTYKVTPILEDSKNEE